MQAPRPVQALRAGVRVASLALALVLARCAVHMCAPAGMQWGSYVPPRMRAFEGGVAARGDPRQLVSYV